MKKIYYLIAMAFMALTFTGCADVPEPYGQPVSPKKETVDPAGSGSVSDPYNVAGAIAKCKEIGDVVSKEKFYIKGYAATEGKADADFGNASFYMTDFKDGSGKRFYAYQVTGSDGQKMKEGYTIKVGDEVVIYGPMYNYNSKTPETASKGAAYIVTVNGQKTENSGGDEPSGDAKGTGTQSDPFNIAAAIAKCKEIGTTVSTENYYVKGYVVIGGIVTGGYGNVSFDMADSKDGGAIFKAFQVAGTDGEKLKDGYEVKAGSEVVVYGPIYNYQGNTPETAGKSAAQIVTIDGKPTSDSGGDTPTETLGTKDNPLNVAKALEYISALADNAKTDKFAYVKGTIKTIKTKDEDIAKYKNIDYIITDGTNDVTVFRGKNLDNTDFTAAGQINVGDEVIVYGQLTKYVKDGAVTPEVAQGNYLVSLKSGGSGGGGGQSSYSINFKTNGQGEWTINDKTKPAEVEKIWQYDSKYGMKASAFASSTNYASESLLISPQFSLEGASKATLTIKHAINFFASVDAAKTEAQVLVSIDGGTNWTALTLNGWPDKLSWTFFESTADFSAYAGKKDLQIALKYSSTADKAGTWEIESVTIE